MIKTKGFSYEKIKFPCGELNINIKGKLSDIPVNEQYNAITFEFENIEEIIELLLICDGDLVVDDTLANIRKRIND